MRWFDAHLDLAALAVNGRDMTKPPAESGGPWPPAAVTFPSLREGRVDAFLGTIFTEAGGDDQCRYTPGDPDSAHAAGLRQLELYQRWHREGLITLARPSPAPFTPPPPGSPPTCLLLMECADPIRTPDELPWWAAQGVRAIGLAWARGSRYATGNSAASYATGVGLTAMGRALVQEMDRLAIVHDASHLSDRALDDLLSLTTRPVVATHSNSRAVLEQDDPASQTGNHRHLRDDHAKEIARRGGVIGLNLCANFCRAHADKTRRPSIADAIRHVTHFAALLGSTRPLGLGSDLDGGFSALHTPEGIETPAAFDLLANELRQQGWTQADVEGFAWTNWASFWARH